MDLTLLNSAWAQLGAVGLLLVFGWWIIRSDRKRCADERTQYIVDITAERNRNQTYSERLISIAESSAKTAAETKARDDLINKLLASTLGQHT